MGDSSHDSESYIAGSTSAETLTGTASDNLIIAGGGDDVISAGNGNNEVRGGGGADQISAGYSGSNQLDGGAGDDAIRMGRVLSRYYNHGAVASGHSSTLEGGTGNDRLEGWTGSDTYVFNRGDGQDVINDQDSGYNYWSQTSWGKTDRLPFGAGIAASDLWLSRDIDDLVIDSVGNDDQVRIENWYTGSQYQIEQIQATDGLLSNNAVDQLVNAMASFGVPSGVGAVVPQDTKDQLAPVLASSWQAS